MGQLYLFYVSEINIILYAFIHAVQLPCLGGYGGASQIHGPELEAYQLVSHTARRSSVKTRVTLVTTIVIFVAA